MAGLNMSDPSEQCPSAWREYNASGVRACRRPTTSSGGYPATFDSMLLVVNTAECVGELLVIKSEIQMPFLVFKQFHNHLTPTMSMESVSLMEHLITTSEHMLLVYQKASIDSNETTVLAATLVILIMHTHHILLETTTVTTVNQAIQRAHLS